MLIIKIEKLNTYNNNKMHDVKYRAPLLFFIVGLSNH